ncbi:MAG: tetratricopeptide repeat protein, partial [Anaeromyxobacteraceae bacterium]
WNLAICATALGDGARAIDELRRALAADPDCLEARRELAALYETADPPAAIEEHRRLLATDPARPESWRALHRLFEAAQAHDRAFVTAGVLRFLGLSDATTDGATYSQNALHAPGGTSQVLAASEWLALRHPADRGALSDLLALVGHALADLAVVPGAAREKLRGAQPLARMAAEICATFGLEEPVLRPGAGAEAAAEPADPPALRIGPDLARRHAVPEQRFLVGRAAARLRARSALAAQLAPAQLREVLAAVVRIVRPEYDGLGHPSEVLARAVARALPRKVKKALEDHARELTRAGAPDVAAWHAGLAATADRAGLLVAGDIPAALGLVLRAGGDVARGPDEIAAAVRARKGLAELLTFAVSEDHLRLRQRLRLAVA